MPEISTNLKTACKKSISESWEQTILLFVLVISHKPNDSFRYENRHYHKHVSAGWVTTKSLYLRLSLCVDELRALHRPFLSFLWMRDFIWSNKGLNGTEKRFILFAQNAVIQIDAQSVIKVKFLFFQIEPNSDRSCVGLDFIVYTRRKSTKQRATISS